MKKAVTKKVTKATASKSRSVSAKGKAAVKSKGASKAIKKEAKVDKRKQVVKDGVKEAKGRVHYILILDDSGSMTGSPWKDLKTATGEFLKTLGSSSSAKTAKVSCVIYNHTSRIVFKDQVPGSGLQSKI